MFLFLLLNWHIAFLPVSKIAWTTPPIHNFGEILRGGESTHIFTFKNISDAAITIDNVRTDCGCTATDWEATPVLPQQSGRIKVSFDANKTGFFKKKITVWVHNQRKPERLTIEGEVIEK